MKYPDFNIEGKTAVVTGASKGIGYGLAKSLAHAGVKVAAAARSRELLDKLVQEIRADGGEARAYELDVRDVPSIAEVYGRIRNDFGRIDIAVNNAGMGAPVPAVEITEDYWNNMMSLNMRGLFFCCRAAGKIMLEQKEGRIINMSSQAAVVGIPEESVYCASKARVNMLTKVLALEWSDKGITINAIGPTFIKTPGTAERLDDPNFRAAILSKLPIGRVGEISDVAGAVLYLASPAASMVTGSFLLVDGGWTAQ
ncbi:MAG: SDR family NAD(P)-dependent oxidoreductase [Spirochaetia bacterium]